MRCRPAPALATTLVALLVCAGCTGSAGHSSGFPVRTVTPSAPGGTGMTMCPDFEVSATTPHGTKPLVSCAGDAGLVPTPVVRVKVGDEVLISGFEIGDRARVTPRPGNLLDRAGHLFRARTPGTTTLMITGYFCADLSSGPHATCALAKIVARA
jgi:hypothetical protein